MNKEQVLDEIEAIKLEVEGIRQKHQQQMEEILDRIEALHCRYALTRN